VVVTGKSPAAPFAQELPTVRELIRLRVFAMVSVGKPVFARNCNPATT